MKKYLIDYLNEFAAKQDEQRVIKLYFVLCKLYDKEQAARITNEVAAKLEELKGVALDYNFIHDGAARCTSVKDIDVSDLDNINDKTDEEKQRILEVVKLISDAFCDILQSVGNNEQQNKFMKWLKKLDI